MSPSCPFPLPERASLYLRLGGQSVVEHVVDALHTAILADPRLIPIMKGLDVRRSYSNQVVFVSYALGGTHKYTGRALHDIHKGMIQNAGLNTSHFDIAVEHLIKIFQDAKIPHDMIEEAVACLVPLRPAFGADYHESMDHQPLEQALAACPWSAHLAKQASSPALLLSSNGSLQSSTQVVQQATLADRLGGEPVLQAIAEALLPRLRQDPELAPFFAGMPAGCIKCLQASYLAFAFGATEDYEGRNLVKAHAHLIRTRGLGLRHFDLTTDHFRATLQQLGIEQPLVQEAADVLLTVRGLFDPAMY